MTTKAKPDQMSIEISARCAHCHRRITATVDHRDPTALFAWYHRSTGKEAC